MNAFFDAMSRYADFEGRTSRLDFLMFHVVFIGLAVGLGLLEDMLGWAPADDVGLLVNVYFLLMLLPSISIGVRRFHDAGRSGWWYALVLVPLVGFVVYAVLFFLPPDGAGDEIGAHIA